MSRPSDDELEAMAMDLDAGHFPPGPKMKQAHIYE